MDDSRLTGAKEGVQTMLFYYLLALQGNVKDPKQVIATELGHMIDLSEEQIQYVQSHISTQSRLVKSLSSSVQLLENMEKTGKLDLESVSIIKDTLNVMIKEINDVVEKFVVVSDNEDETSE